MCMKSVEELIKLKDLYEKRMKKSKENIERFKGKLGEREWTIQFFMARGKVEVLNYLVKEES